MWKSMSNRSMIIVYIRYHLRLRYIYKNRNDSVFTDEEEDSIASRMKRKRRRNRQPEDDNNDNNSYEY